MRMLTTKFNKRFCVAYYTVVTYSDHSLTLVYSCMNIYIANEWSRQMGKENDCCILTCNTYELTIYEHIRRMLEGIGIIILIEKCGDALSHL